MSDTLYTRLGGYDAIVVVGNDLLPRLTSDAKLGRFWKHWGQDGVLREKQLPIDFLCNLKEGIAPLRITKYAEALRKAGLPE